MYTFSTSSLPQYYDPANADLTMVWRMPGTGMVIPESWNGPFNFQDFKVSNTESEVHGGLGKADGKTGDGNKGKNKGEGDDEAREGEGDSGDSGEQHGNGTIVTVLPVAPTVIEGQGEPHNPTFHTEDIVFQDASLIPHFGRFMTSASMMNFRVDAAVGASIGDLANGIPRGWWTGDFGPPEQTFVPFALVPAEERRARLMKASRAFAEDFPCAGPGCDIRCIASPSGVLPSNGPSKIEGLYTLGCWKAGHRSSMGTRIPDICPTKSWVVRITAEEKEG